MPFGVVLLFSVPSEITITAKTMTNRTNAKLLPQLIEQCADFISSSPFLHHIVRQPGCPSRWLDWRIRGFASPPLDGFAFIDKC
jgi:hypothetical protein